MTIQLFLIICYASTVLYGGCASGADFMEHVEKCQEERQTAQIILSDRYGEHSRLSAHDTSQTTNT